MKAQNKNYQLPIYKGCNAQNYINKGKKYDPLFSTAQIIQLIFALFFIFYFLGHALISVGA